MSSQTSQRSRSHPLKNTCLKISEHLFLCVREHSLIPCLFTYFRSYILKTKEAEFEIEKDMIEVKKTTRLCHSK